MRSFRQEGRLTCTLFVVPLFFGAGGRAMCFLALPLALLNMTPCTPFNMPSQKKDLPEQPYLRRGFRVEY